MSSENSFVSVKPTMEYSAPPDCSDDEDSFVVLETSSPSLNDSTPVGSMAGEVLPPLRTNKVHEMQNLLKLKISELSSEEIPEAPTALETLNAVASSVAKITISPDSSYEEIQKQVEELIKENETLKNIIAQNNLSMKMQYDRFVAYKDEVMNVMKSYKDKISEAKVCIDKGKEENSKLASEVEIYRNIKKLHEEEILNLKENLKKTELGESCDPKIEELQTELAKANLRNAELETEIEQQKQIVDNLTKEIENLKSEIDSKNPLEIQLQTKDQEINVLQFDISNLKTELTKVRRENDDLKIKLSNNPQISDLNSKLEAAHSKEELLSNELLNLQQKYSDIQKQFNPTLQEDYQQIRKQLSLAQQKITALRTDQDTKIEEIEKLRKIIQEANAKEDEIFALKEQVTLFQCDYEAEKQSKLIMKKEKEQMLEDLQNVQKRNKQLQNEIETLRARYQPQPEGYQCPKCSFGFTTYQSLENHVHRCLDLGEFP